MNKLFVLILLLVALFGSTEALNKHHKKHSATKKHSITKVAKAEQHATTKKAKAKFDTFNFNPLSEGWVDMGDDDKDMGFLELGRRVQ